MRSLGGIHAALTALAAAGVATAATSPYKIDTADNIKQAASTVAWDMLQYYHGNESGNVPGILPGPPPAGDYYWWEGGAMWGTLLDYWALTGDETYNSLISQALLFQVGDHADYMPLNYTLSLGNDDQGFWGMSAMLAAENKFPDPPSDQPQWLALAQAVFNTMADPLRHDSVCGGGMRWQIPSTNKGYNYKNSIANGCFFNIGARLARYTKNQTYADWADKTWDWMVGVGLMGPEDEVYDGGHVEYNCTDINKAEFSYNNAVFLLGSAYMWNYTEDQKWKDRVNKLTDHGIATFFPDNVAYEPTCEDYLSCTTDMKSFKGYLHRWYATATKVAPFITDKVLPVLRLSTEAAITTCTGGALGRQCGFDWKNRTFDNNIGAGQQMNVLGALSSLLINNTAGPVSADTGGTSQGNPNAGSKSDDFRPTPKPVTAGDRAGAAILTILVVGAATALFIWISMGENGSA
ncbi:unnamed protein product [Clonostachys chloroleuca]|uniref:Mannan endo-1,6-alpha-mannosidase n=1 Tax=Clonostachys chloroleuca TaxID=1926264 RepID=A0AA35Q9X2_9HYPO|nr:unnamed protein product [Clonostachys chloroleuca]